MFSYLSMEDLSTCLQVSPRWRRFLREALHILLKGIEVNSRDEFGLTPWMNSALRGQTKVFELYLEHPKIRISLKDKMGGGVLTFAAIAEK